MKLFIQVFFWVQLFDIVGRIAFIGTGKYAEPRSLNIYAADTVIAAIILIWAGFVLWYKPG